MVLIHTLTHTINQSHDLSALSCIALWWSLFTNKAAVPRTVVDMGKQVSNNAANDIIREPKKTVNTSTSVSCGPTIHDKKEHRLYSNYKY